MLILVYLATGVIPGLYVTDTSAFGVGDPFPNIVHILCTDSNSGVIIIVIVTGFGKRDLIVQKLN